MRVQPKILIVDGDIGFRMKLKSVQADGGSGGGRKRHSGMVTVGKRHSKTTSLESQSG